MDNPTVVESNKVSIIGAVEEQSSYRQIMKATSIFGGVQVFQIIIQLIRSKFIAILLGPAGMGIVGLLNSTIGLIGGLTNFGLGTSAVKNVSAVNATGNETRIATIITVLRRLVWTTGLLGTIITIVLSSWLSELTFGNSDYTIAFVWISITLLFKQLSTGQLVLLQGLRKIQYLAKANVTGSFSGLIITVPLYYYFGIDAIVPGIIISALISLLFSWYFSNKIDIANVKVSKVRTVAESKDMIEMGFMISLNGVLVLISAYFLRIYISNTGGIDQVGLYSAGFAIVNSYVGMIFTAMGTDYYPRLSAVNTDNYKVRVTVEQQALIALLVLIPIIILFQIFASFFIQLLYSNKFMPIVQMVNFAILGMFFRAVSWSIGFILLAKGESKLLLKTGISFSIVFLINNILGYKLLGLTGIGLSFILNYLFHLVVLLVITKHRYSFYFSRIFLKVFFISLVLCVLGFSVTLVPNDLLKYALGILLLICSAIYSFKELDKRLNFKESFLQHL